MKVISGIVGGLLLAVLAALLFGIMFASSKGSSMGVIGFFAAWAAGLTIAVTAPTAAKAWRRMLITAAVLAFMLPLAGIVFTGSVATELAGEGPNAGARAAGAVIGGGIVSGFLGFVGFFLGVICLVVGLLVGRDKQIIYVQAPPAT